MNAGVKGYQYRGWQVRNTWSAAKGCNTYTASSPDRPGQTATFTKPAEVERWIDAQEMGAPQTAPVSRPTQRNRYGAWCRRCNHWVEPGEGVLFTWDEAERQGLRLPKRPGYIVVHTECPPPTLAEQRKAQDAATALQLADAVREAMAEVKQ